MPSIGDRLQDARSQRFVGRDAEVHRFRAALTAEVPPFHVLYVFGPGGVGKTELLQAFARCCDEEGCASAYLDARDVDPSPEAFRTALREAFKDLHRPDQLQDTPLLYSRVVTSAVGPDADVPDRIEALRSLLEETAERLADDPRDEKYHRAVHRTYVQPAPTQEKAAEQLGVPFSTFRRHLNRGLERVADILWEREVGVSG